MLHRSFQRTLYKVLPRLLIWFSWTRHSNNVYPFFFTYSITFYAFINSRELLWRRRRKKNTIYFTSWCCRGKALILYMYKRNLSVSLSHRKRLTLWILYIPHWNHFARKRNSKATVATARIISYATVKMWCLLTKMLIGFTAKKDFAFITDIFSFKTIQFITHYRHLYHSRITF